MNVLDRVIGYFAPGWAISRVSARATLSQIDALTGGASKAGYEAGRLTRNTRHRLTGRVKENHLPWEEIERVQGSSWQLYRNNCYARKIVRSLESKVIGKGLHPESQAVNADGTPNTEFRTRAKQLWMAIQNKFDARGLPGRGGMTFGGLQRLALRSVMLSGDTLYRLKPLKADAMIQRESPIPLALQIIDSMRLADDVEQSKIASGHKVCRGIEFDTDENRVAYWISDGESTKSYPVAEIGHIFVEEDIDQIRGTPWFAPAILQIRDTGDLQYNVLKASAMAACVVMGYRKPTGSTRFGLSQSVESESGTADGTDLTDVDGNAITKIQPGMFINLGKDGELQGFNPNQPNINAEGFIQHMLRGTAAGIAGTKASTVTGDYRQASFSSEKAADNDTWPEVMALQEWFSTSFCQPIFEAVVRAGVLTGYFDGVVDPNDFTQHPERYLSASWQGPVSQSINPEKDASAAGLRMEKGLSSLQMECAKIAVDWREVLEHASEVYAAAEALDLPEEFVNNLYGVGSQDSVVESPSANGADSVDPATDAPADAPIDAGVADVPTE